MNGSHSRNLSKKFRRMACVADAVVVPSETDPAIDEAPAEDTDHDEPMSEDAAPEETGTDTKSPAKKGAKKQASKKSVLTPKKARKSSGDGDTHPKYSQMINDAVANLKDRNGSSRQAILKYILANYTVQTDERQVNNHLKMSLRAGVKSGKLKQSKGSGACGKLCYILIRLSADLYVFLFYSFHNETDIVRKI